MSQVTWHIRWLDMVDLVASWSKDPSTKVGAVIVDDRDVVLALGWNGIPRGVRDDAFGRNQRPIKYSFYEHAERNAIYNAAAKGVGLQGSTLYTSFIPCADCGRAVIQSGIKTVVVRLASCNERWKNSEDITQLMFQEAGIKLLVFNYEEHIS